MAAGSKEIVLPDDVVKQIDAKLIAEFPLSSTSSAAAVFAAFDRAISGNGSAYIKKPTYKPGSIERIEYVYPYNKDDILINIFPSNGTYATKDKQIVYHYNTASGIMRAVCIDNDCKVSELMNDKITIARLVMRLITTTDDNKSLKTIGTFIATKILEYIHTGKLEGGARKRKTRTNRKKRQSRKRQARK